MWRILLVFYFIAIPAGMSRLFIDIGTFHFKGEGKHGIRIVFFDTNTQILKEAHYIPLRSKRLKQHTAFQNAFFKTNFSGDIVLFKDFDKDKVTIRTFGCIQGGKSLTPFVPSPAPLRQLKALAHLKKGNADCKIYFYTPSGKVERTFCSLSLDTSANRIERGILGELLTDITFLTLGFMKIEAQNKSNQGLDGVFLHSNENLLVVTESKCRAEAKRAKRYLDEDLSEPKIVARVKEIPDATLKNTLFHHLDTKLAGSFKLAQRLTTSGFIESAFEAIDGLFYVFARYPDPKVAPAFMQKNLLESLLTRLGVPQHKNHIVTAYVMGQMPRRS